MHRDARHHEPNAAGLLPALALLAALTGCAAPSGGGGQGQVAPLPPPAYAKGYVPAPSGAPPASCWGRAVTPAIIETRSEQVLVPGPRNATDGSTHAPDRYRTVTRQVIVRERGVHLFEAVCPDRLDPAFVASLQRALAARGAYRGPITGQLDAATLDAVRRLQSRDGPDSPLLSVALARRLGLIPVPRDEL